MKLQRTHNCGELRKEQVGQEVILNGWVANRRDHGGVYFVDLRDRFGLTQVRLDPGMDDLANLCRPECVVAVRGVVEGREGSMANLSRPTGEVEIKVAELEVLNESKVPPFEVQDEIDSKEDTRLKYRYVDMRRRPVNDAIIYRSRVCQIIREVFHGKQFVEVETPLLMKTTPEGARDFIVP
ncbi:MAG: Asp-tRNA(Asn)/Glu-tRNA(Gln) amidotransferase GatCAB subunit C, partial [Salinibacterium sp.]|nr:Asp-tRNA(Asn)/Glu-tRNA(Gln) amidotransferase GatCAB subunit C [Salinibacterium sp.]